MQKITIEMPWVAQCNVQTCAYNQEKACHAEAITVGHGETPGCDTFFQSARHAQSVDVNAGVGACKVDGCRYNSDFECNAESITVGYVGREARCQTFTPR